MPSEHVIVFIIIIIIILCYVLFIKMHQHGTAQYKQVIFLYEWWALTEKNPQKI